MNEQELFEFMKYEPEYKQQEFEFMKEQEVLECEYMEKNVEKSYSLTRI